MLVGIVAAAGISDLVIVSAKAGAATPTAIIDPATTAATFEYFIATLSVPVSVGMVNDCG
jgi:hypothetical protein